MKRRSSLSFILTVFTVLTTQPIKEMLVRSRTLLITRFLSIRKQSLSIDLPLL